MLEDSSKPIRFQLILDALLNDDADFPEYYLSAFSDINPENFQQLTSIWNQITPERKARLIENLEVLNDTDTLVDFSDVASLALTDSIAAVRAGGIRMLWDYEDDRHIPKLIDILKNDVDLSVRAHAAGALGKFIYLGEIEDISVQQLEKVENVLIETIRSSENELVRRNALESLGFSSHDDVDSLISTAYQSGDEEWLASSLLAMGRSANEVWTPQVLSMLPHPDFRIQREAIRAAGELEIKQARKLLLKFILDSEPDEDIWTESVWALSKIGGENVQSVFEKLLKNADTEEEEEFLQEAINNLLLTNGIAGDLEFMGFAEPNPEALREFDITDVDLEESEGSWVDELEEALEEDIDEDFYGDDGDDDDADYEDEDIEDELEDEGFHIQDDSDFDDED